MTVVRGPRVGSMEILVLGLVAFAISGAWLRAAVAGSDTLATAATVFCGVFVQALPFLGLGVVVSGLIAAYVNAERLSRGLPRRPPLALPLAGIGGGGPPRCAGGAVPGGGRPLRPRPEGGAGA